MYFIETNMWLIITTGVVLLVVITFIGILLWGYKSRVATKRLASIDEQIKTFKGEPSCEGKAEKMASNEESPPVAATEKEPIRETVIDKHNVGKSGRVYTREQLETQIKS